VFEQFPRYLAVLDMQYPVYPGRPTWWKNGDPARVSVRIKGNDVAGVKGFWERAGLLEVPQTQQPLLDDVMEKNSSSRPASVGE